MMWKFYISGFLLLIEYFFFGISFFLDWNPGIELGILIALAIPGFILGVSGILDVENMFKQCEAKGK